MPLVSLVPPMKSIHAGEEEVGAVVVIGDLMVSISAQRDKVEGA